jgi:hypothetical protein
MRAALEYSLEEYVAQHYPTGTGAVYCPPKAGSGDQATYVLCISSGAFQPHNYWNGTPRFLHRTTHATRHAAHDTHDTTHARHTHGA